MLLFWIGFYVLIVLLLVADLGIFHRKVHAVRFKEALRFSCGWIVLALLFNLFIYIYFGSDKALQFFTGYLIEKSLSVDNLFVFLLLFHHLRISPVYQHKILFWGIIGALIFRLSLILVGVTLIEKFYWMYYVFGALLLISGVKFAFEKEKKQPEQSVALRFFKKILPMSKAESGGHFFIKEKGEWKTTTLFLTLLMIESADIIFALDSIPAIFAITTDPFIIYTSNVFAILGLRSLYFVLAPSLKKLRYFRFGLAAILIFIGAKMILADVVFISVVGSLCVILAILAVTIVASLKTNRN